LGFGFRVEGLGSGVRSSGFEDEVLPRGARRSRGRSRQSTPASRFGFWSAGTLRLLYSRYRSLRRKLSGARVYKPQIRVRLVTTAHSCEVVDAALDADSGESEKDSY